MNMRVAGRQASVLGVLVIAMAVADGIMFTAPAVAGFSEAFVGVVRGCGVGALLVVLGLFWRALYESAEKR
jgi:hypothetical protein